MILIDTSVWVAHFRNPNETLRKTLRSSLALTHPLIIGEIACGTPPYRKTLLREFQRIRSSMLVRQAEVLAFIEREKLYGLGCGFVDLSLLCSTLMTRGAQLWTLDKRLNTLAHRFEVSYQDQLL